MSVVINHTAASVGRSVTAQYFGTGDGSRTLFNLAGLDSDRAYLMPVLYMSAPLLDFVTEGDSITAGASNWPYQLFPSGNEENTFTDYAVAGDTTTDMSTRYDTYKTTLGVGKHFAVMGGINDIAANVALATIQANFTHMWLDSTSRGAIVVAMTTTPFNQVTTNEAKRLALNVWIQQQAVANGYVFVDTATALMDPANPHQLLPAYDSGDGTHPTAAGVTVIRDAVASAAFRVSNSPSTNYKLYSTARENLLVRSEYQNTAPWVATGLTVSAAIAGPDGRTNAWTLTATGVDGSLLQSVARTTGDHTASYWIRRRTGTGAVNILKVDGTGAGTLLTLTSAWQRVSMSGTSGAVNAFCGVVIHTSGDAVDICKTQLEPGLTMTRYIYTDTVAVSITDYAVDATGKVTTNPAFPVGATLNYQDPFAPSGNILRAFGAGDDTSADFSLPFAPDVPAIYDNGSVLTITTDYSYSPNGDVTFVVAPTAAHPLTADFNLGPQP